MYKWLQELMAAARRAGASEGLDDDGNALRNDLIGNLDSAEGGEGEGPEGDEGDSDGETNQNVKMEVSGKQSKGRGGRPLSPEEIRKLLEQGAQIKPAEGEGGAEGEGMYLTQLTGKQAQDLEELREQLGEIGPASNHGRLVLMHGRNQDSYYSYDEWDYVAADYRREWCRLREIPLAGDDNDFFAQTLARYSEMLPQVRRHFQRIRPASYRMVRGLEDGEELDLERLVETRVSRLMGESPDPRVYSARKKESRDVATLFLLDMSASTDEPIHREVRKATADDDDHSDDWMKAWQRRPQQSQRPRRIIDVNKEALVIMAEALEEIGDSYAIMGFSGHGRDNVEFYVIKEFSQALSDEVKARVGAVEPKRSTRMGAAIRHVREKFKDVSSRAKHMILLSDGFPQDFDYGHDRRSNAYGIQDTMVALKELEMARGAAVLHHGRSHRPRLPAPDVRAVALSGDRGHHLAAAQSCRRFTSRSSAGRPRRFRVARRSRARLTFVLLRTIVGLSSDYRRTIAVAWRSSDARSAWRRTPRRSSSTPSRPRRRKAPGRRPA